MKLTALAMPYMPVARNSFLLQQRVDTGVLQASHVQTHIADTDLQVPMAVKLLLSPGTRVAAVGRSAAGCSVVQQSACSICRLVDDCHAYCPSLAHPGCAVTVQVASDAFTNGVTSMRLNCVPTCAAL
jgi:hypothetical protein